ncbi:MAG: hypothetical protein GX060_03045 [Firmicutes bacterium]|nr:hypothetical protein [Bacillota bacterium]
MRKVNLQLTACLVVGALLVGVWVGHGYAASSTAAPGSDLDPLVTKSYVDDAISKLASQVENNGQSGEPNGDAAPTLTVVTVPAGSRLIAYEGTEFVLRSGKATIIGSAAGGVPDLTAGKDLPNNATAPANHLLLFPRSDQRGLKASTNIIVMVRGEYTVEP